MLNISANSTLKLVILPMGFKKQNNIISIVDNEMLYFVEHDRHGRKKAIEGVKLADLLNENADDDLIPFSAKYRSKRYFLELDLRR